LFSMASAIETQPILDLLYRDAAADFASGKSPRDII
jgi:hypothetical protein